MKWVKRILLVVLVFLILCTVGFFVAYLAASGEYKVRATVDKDRSLPRLVVRGVLFHGEVLGAKDAPLVIVIHGGPGNDYRYLLPLRGLSDTYRVLFYDQRGTGLSPRVPKEQLTLETMIEDLVHITRQFGRGKPVRLIGHSWGAMLASAVAGRHPELYSHIVLAEPGLLTTKAAREFIKRFSFTPNLTATKELLWIWLKSLHVKGPDKWAQEDYFFTAMMHVNVPGHPILGYACGRDIRTMSLATWRYGSSASRQIQGKAFARGKDMHIDLVKGIQRYKGKTLFVTGECNKVTGAAFQKQYHMKFFPGAKLKVIKGAGHTMFGEKAKESIRVLRTFFTQPIKK